MIFKPFISLSVMLSVLGAVQLAVGENPFCERHGDGDYPYMNSCSKFFKCANGFGSVHDCPGDLLFDTSKMLCLRALWNKDAVNQAKRPSPGIGYKKWTKREISSYTGIEPGTPILIGVKGKVYDVSAGRGFYGPGASYNVFAGRDASRLLATQSFDDGVTEEEMDAPIDTLDDLTADDMESLDAYVGLFTVKYRCVGELVDSVDGE
ncbi:Dihydrodipicolinate synthase [Kickxella alabastrina]|uniref:Dihydrodipicolinate synthase n=1 Tax=Kickxella alabastrina TaxID=61397 RepID=A0ACC1IM73_9FUNG|nr:Dihydrodipicolinate synthase [Kickxella alabastrina]